MIQYALYYAISLILLLGIVQWLVNLVLLRTKAKSLYGQKFKPGTRKYDGVMQLASNKVIFISSLIVIPLAINFLHSINKLKSLEIENTSLILIMTTLFVSVLVVSSYFFTRATYQDKDS
jgi:hypothetical protein